MNVKCISNDRQNYLIVGNVYEVLGQRKIDGRIFYEILPNTCRTSREFPKDMFDQTNNPVTPRFPFRVKCKFDFTWVFPYSGGHRKRSLSKYITTGNVYEVVDIIRDGYYIIIPDHGTQTEELPNENFGLTTEPVTINLQRQQEETTKIVEAQKRITELENERASQAITDAMDQYYCPDRYRARQLAKKRKVAVLQQIFVGGLSYE